MNDLKNQDCYLKTKEGNKDMKVSQAKHVVIYCLKKEACRDLNKIKTDTTSNLTN